MISVGEPTPFADGTINEVRGNLPASEGKYLNARFDACCVTEKALRLGLLISPTEHEGETEAETRLTGILQAYMRHLEKHIEPTAGVSFSIRSYTIVVALFMFTAYDWCRLRSPNSVSCLPETETTPTLASPS